jgi:hypothetical protein
MSDLNVIMEGRTKAEESASNKVNPSETPVWETPTLEDVSEQVMAQPYIRFT